MPADIVTRIDHLVFGTPDLNVGIAEIEKRLGITPTPGGQHPGRGTRNALVGLGPATYLEIISPDPDQPPPTGPRPFGLDAVTESRLIGWFVRAHGLESVRADANEHGVPLGEVKAGRRTRPDGVELSWQFTDPTHPVADGVVPFFIDWGASPHPAAALAAPTSLVSLRVRHPNAASVERMMKALGLDLAVERSAVPALVATIDCPNGQIELW